MAKNKADTARGDAAKQAFGFIPTIGINRVREMHGKDLDYGLEHGMFTQKAIDSAQKRYEERKKRGY